MGGDELVTLLVRLVNHPSDAEARKRAVDLLDGRGLIAEAQTLLATFVNFTGHEESSPLPCLCAACIARAPQTATSSDGVLFTRAFVVADTRVLHFWLIDQLAADRDDVRRAVSADLRARLAGKRRA